MDQHAETHEAPVSAQGLRRRFQYLLLVLIICFWFGLVDWRFLLFGIFILYILSPFAVGSSELDVTVGVPSGKYIPKEVRLNVLHEEQHTSSVSSPSVEESLGVQNSVRAEQEVVLQVEPDTSEEPTNGDDSTTSLGDEQSPQAEVEVIEESADHQTSVEAEDDEAAREQPGTVEELKDGQPLQDIKDDRAPLSDQAMINSPFTYRISDEGKRLDSRKIVSLTDRWSLEDEEEGESPWIAPPSGAGLVIKRLVKTGAISELATSLSRFRISAATYRVSDEGKRLDSRKIVSLTDRWGLEDEEEEESSWIAPRFGAGIVLKRLVKPEAISELEISLSQFRISAQRPPTEPRPNTIPQPVVDGSGATDRMDIDEKAEGQVEGGRQMGVLTSQQAGADSAVETEGDMVGIEFQEQVKESLVVGPSMGSSRQAADDSHVNQDQVMDGSEVDQVAGDGDEVLADADSEENHEPDAVDEVMIGSDVEAAMEVDDETTGSGGDSGVVDADSMKLEDDGPQSQVNETGSHDSMDIEPQCSRVTVNMDKVHEKIRREKAEFALRKTSANETERGMNVSGLGGALTNSSQQPAAPASMLETGAANTTVLQIFPQHLISTNSAADLREARRGKRPEARTVEEAVVRPLASPQPLVTTASPPSPTSADGATSDTITSTPTSTPPTSTSTTPPRSPAPRNMASINGSPKPPSVKAEEVPGKRKLKRGCDSLDDASDEEQLDDDMEHASAIPGAQTQPASGPPKVSPTRRVLMAKPLKRVRKAPTPGTDVNRANGDQSTQASRSSPPTPPPPAPSSKKTRTTPNEDAGSSQAVTPLNDIPDQTLTEAEKQGQYFDAAWNLFDHDASSDEEK